MSTFDWSVPGATGATVETNLPAGKVDHVKEALSRLVEQFKDKPKIVALVTNIGRRFQDVEDALWDLLTKRSVDTAEGAQLDRIGKIVKQSRNGLADDDYRRYIRARIAALKSRGTFEDLITVCVLVIGDALAVVKVRDEGTATCVIYIDGIVLSDALAAIVHDIARFAAAAGVRLLVEYSRSIPANTFRLDSGPGFDVGHLAGALE